MQIDHFFLVKVVLFAEKGYGGKSQVGKVLFGKMSCRTVPSNSRQGSTCWQCSRGFLLGQNR